MFIFSYPFSLVLVIDISADSSTPALSVTPGCSTSNATIQAISLLPFTLNNYVFDHILSSLPTLPVSLAFLPSFKLNNHLLILFEYFNINLLTKECPNSLLNLSSSFDF